MNMLEGIKFIDLFAGIGGFHIALSKYGAECVFSSEWDKYAKITYEENFGIKPNGDITQINEKDIPDHDILCAGFPCQAFSISGRQLGFNDTRGTLFFDVARIIKEKKPKVVILENVKNFAKHDNGNTLAVVKNTLNELGYSFNYEVLNASNFGLPQKRERVFMVAIADREINFSFPIGTFQPISLNDVIDKELDEFQIIREDIKLDNEKINEIYQSNISYNKPLRIGTINKGGQGERIYSTFGHAITLSAYGGGPGSKTGCYLVNDKIRKLSPRECARVQGFPDSFKINVSNSQAWKQFGNSIPIKVLEAIIETLITDETIYRLLKS